MELLGINFGIYFALAGGRTLLGEFVRVGCQLFYHEAVILVFRFERHCT